MGNEEEKPGANEVTIADVTRYASLFGAAGWDIQNVNDRPEPATANAVAEASLF